MPLSNLSQVIIVNFCLIFLLCLTVKAQTNQLVYTDSLQNGWQDYSWAQVNFNNSTPAHSGTASASVNAAAYQAIYLHHTSFSTSAYVSLSFWVHGGTSGGQLLQLNGTSGGLAQTTVNLAPLTANSWQQVTVPLSSLGFNSSSVMDGFWIQDRSGTTQGTFYVDDITLTGGTPPPPQTNSLTIAVNANLNRHAINPMIYGTAFATTAQLLDLNSPLNRQGGNNMTRYNWQINARNLDNDYYFESYPFPDATAGEYADTFVQDSKAGGAQPMLTVPMIDWIAKLGPNRARVPSFSIAKYGAQTSSDQYFPDAGNGIRTNGQFVTGNDPNDANVPNSVGVQQAWLQHLIGRWGNAANGGVRYYLLDNEHSIWFSTHRDVHPTGPNMEEIFGKMRDYSAMIKTQDSNALTFGPEEFGWSGYIYSGYDLQYGAAHNYSSFPDRAAHGNLDYVVWLLQQFKADEQTRGKRLLDVFTLHYYPQNNEFSDDVSSSTQLLRNRSTRSLWDPNYTDESYINDQVQLIPRMRNWVAGNYPNTKIGITEYNWGAENHINGATTQADIFGIFGRENLDLATRWTTPDAGTPVYNAIKMYRNYDGSKSTFGETSVSAVIPNPDEASAFASVRTSDGALTVMVINKSVNTEAANINIANFAGGNSSQVWQLTSANQINRLADAAVVNNAVNITLPPQSITLFVIGKLAPTAAKVSISGKVSANGRGTANARVEITGTGNNTRSVITNSFGNFTIPDVDAGATYVISVSAKRYAFAPQVISVTDNLSKLEFKAISNF